MDEAIGQGTGHARGDGAVAFTVAGGEHRPAVRQAVFAQGPIEHQLVAGSLDQRRRGVEFVEEQDAGAVRGQECRGGPGRLDPARPWAARADQPGRAGWRGYRSGGCPATPRPGRRPGICRRRAVPRQRRVSGSAPATAGRMRCRTASWGTISRTGRRGASLPATYPSRISRGPLTLLDGFGKHGPVRSGRAGVWD